MDKDRRAMQYAQFKCTHVTIPPIVRNMNKLLYKGFIVEENFPNFV